MSLHILGCPPIVDSDLLTVDNSCPSWLLTDIWHFKSSLCFLVLRVKIVILSLACLKNWLRHELTRCIDIKSWQAGKGKIVLLIWVIRSQFTRSSFWGKSLLTAKYTSCQYVAFIRLLASFPDFSWYLFFFESEIAKLVCLIFGYVLPIEEIFSLIRFNQRMIVGISRRVIRFAINSVVVWLFYKRMRNWCRVRAPVNRLLVNIH